jgi:hypothetical protein
VPRVPVLAAALASVLAARGADADTVIHRAGDRVDVRATAASVAEVLDRLGRETGMKVSYDGAPPRARISVSLTGVTPAQAVLAVLEGQGLNYVLRMDPTATRVETLLMVTGGASSAVAAPTSVSRPGLPPRMIEPDSAEQPEEEAPSEAPAAEEQRKPVFPGIPGLVAPTGPAVPLTLPLPSPAPPSAGGPPTTTPAGRNPQS